MSNQRKRLESAQMGKYNLKITEDKSSTPSRYNLFLLDASGVRWARGTAHTVLYASLEHLLAALSSVRFDEDMLQDIQTGLARTGSHTTRECELSDDQLVLLGFVDLAA